MAPTRAHANGAGQRAASDPTRAKLLQAAADVFAESGYRAATIREISSRAGANVAAVNYHFGDKLELYTAVLRETMQSPSLEAIRSALDHNVPPEQALREVIKAMLGRMCTDDQRDRRWRLMMHELAAPSPAMSRIIDETSRPLYNRLRDLIGVMIRRPSDDREDPALHQQYYWTGDSLRSLAPHPRAHLAGIEDVARTARPHRGAHRRLFAGVSAGGFGQRPAGAFTACKEK